MSEIISFTDLQSTEMRLRAISESVKDKLAQADNMACTEETKKAVKSYRAQLKKEFEAYETERKEKTAEYEKPLTQFKAIYKELIADPFKAADSALKGKIDAVETVQKEEKAQAVKEYADELKASYALEWLDTDRVIPPVSLSASEKSLKTAVKERIDKIKSDIDCIHLIDDSGEMFAEYIEVLDLAQAKLNVIQRREAVEAAERARAAYRQQEDINRAVEERNDILSAPTIEEEPEPVEIKTYTMTFSATGTIEQLKALKAFMIDNNISFTNGGTSNADT